MFKCCLELKVRLFLKFIIAWQGFNCMLNFFIRISRTLIIWPYYQGHPPLSYSEKIYSIIHVAFFSNHALHKFSQSVPIKMLYFQIGKFVFQIIGRISNLCPNHMPAKNLICGLDGNFQILWFLMIFNRVIF